MGVGTTTSVCGHCLACVLEPHFSMFSLFFLCLAAAATLCLYHTVPRALYDFVAVNVQQQSHMKLFLCDRHGRCICVCMCAMFSVDLGSRNEHKIA